MSWVEWLGIFAGLLTTGSFIPQVIRVFKLKSCREISLFFNILYLVGICTWLVYGIIADLKPVILWNAIAAVLIVALLFAKLKYGR